MARRRGAKLLVATVAPEMERNLNIRDSEAFWSDALQKFVKAFPAEGVEVETVVPLGAVHRQIVKLAEKRNVDVIVMGSGAGIAGPPVTLYHDPEWIEDAVDLELVVPVGGGVEHLETPAGRIMKPGEVPGGQVAVAVHVGPYETIHETYQALGTWIEEHDYKDHERHGELVIRAKELCEAFRRPVGRD